MLERRATQFGTFAPQAEKNGSLQYAETCSHREARKSAEIAATDYHSNPSSIRAKVSASYLSHDDHKFCTSFEAGPSRCSWCTQHTQREHMPARGMGERRGEIHGLYTIYCGSISSSHHYSASFLFSLPCTSCKKFLFRFLKNLGVALAGVKEVLHCYSLWALSSGLQSSSFFSPCVLSVSSVVLCHLGLQVTEDKTAPLFLARTCFCSGFCSSAQPWPGMWNRRARRVKPVRRLETTRRTFSPWNGNPHGA